MPQKPVIKLPASLAQELGLGLVTSQRPPRQSSDRKAARKAARVEKRKKPASSNGTLKRRLQHSSTSKSSHHADIVPENGPPASMVKQSKRITEAKPEEPTRRLDISGTKNDKTALESKPSQLPKRVREKIAEDDAEIAALERRLGLKGGRKRLPKSFHEDGLGELLGDLDDSDDGSLHKKPRMSQDEEDWLLEKRRKATHGNESSAISVEDDLMDSDDHEDLDSDTDASRGSDRDSDSQSAEFNDFDGLEDEEFHGIQTRTRENPYVAPQTANAPKYIPPSLRKPEGKDTEAQQRLRRQIQGTINRLSEAKLVATTAEMEKMYRENPRQHVSTILLDALFALVNDPSPLQDTFMILHGGFVAALYKTVGTEFGAQVVQRFIEEYDAVSKSDNSTSGKQLANMVTFLAELYNLQVVGSPLMYDMIRDLTTNLNEEKAELLLRIVRNSGMQLRQDDRASLKDVVVLLHAAVDKQGSENLSVRMKFMIETIENLKNNKVKTGIAASNIRIEHSKNMKKILGSMNTNNIKGREPLRIGLSDIRNADKRGKWWLVGASFNDEKENKSDTREVVKKDSKAAPRSLDIDLNELAREQGMNTEIRRMIFLSMVSAYDHKDALTRLNKLGIKSKQRFEIPRIVVHCVGAEKKYYNRFYTKIASKLCAERDLRKAFQFTLWDIFKRLEEGEEDDEDRLQGEMDAIAIVFIAKMYGELAANGLQNVLLLKHIDLVHPNSKLKLFAQVFLITIFQQQSEAKDASRKIENLFAVIRQEPGMIASLNLFLKKSVRSSKLVQDEERDLVKKCCNAAEGLLLELISQGVASTSQ